MISAPAATPDIGWRSPAPPRLRIDRRHAGDDEPGAPAPAEGVGAEIVLTPGDKGWNGAIARPRMLPWGSSRFVHAATISETPPTPQDPPGSHGRGRCGPTARARWHPGLRRRHRRRRWRRRGPQEAQLAQLQGHRRRTAAKPGRRRRRNGQDLNPAGAASRASTTSYSVSTWRCRRRSIQVVAELLTMARRLAREEGMLYDIAAGGGSSSRSTRWPPARERRQADRRCAAQSRRTLCSAPAVPG